MKHPNQSFIDNFNRSTKSDDRTPVYFYSSDYTEKKRKEKFQYFVESLNNPKNTKNELLTKAIAKIFDYNTLGTNQNKLILEAKQSLGSLPKQFTYNGLLYEFNKELNMFINQHGHAISIEQATAFMEMASFEEVSSFSSESDTDGGTPAKTPHEEIPTVPNTPTNLTLMGISGNGAILDWQDNSTNETEFKVYYAIIPEPQTPTNLLPSNINQNNVTLSWQDNSNNENEFKIYYATIPEPQTPSNLFISNINNSGATLNWQDNSNNENEFKIYYRTE